MENTIARDIAEGVVCEVCLLDLNGKGEAPVVCLECWESIPEDERLDYRLACSEHRDG